MRLREAEVFGSSEFSSPFDVEVRVTKQGNYLNFDSRRPYGFGRFDAEMYALFPTSQSRPRLLKAGLEFDVVIRWMNEAMFTRRVDELRKRRVEENKRREKTGRPSLPEPYAVRELRSHLQGALWAWLSFGGIGSRSRRGCGSVHSEAFSLSGSGAPASALPTASILHGPRCPNAMAAWARAVEVYRDFRQRQRRTRMRRDPSGKTVEKLEGRTFWPEPDSLRRITRCHDRRHPPESTDQSINLFPRAALGLPIIFWFKDGPGRNPSNNERFPPDAAKDPYEAELLPRFLNEQGDFQVGQRMATPVITRALFIDGAWVPGLIILRRPGLSKLSAQLQGRGIDASGGIVPIDEVVAEIQITEHPSLAGLSPMAGMTSAVDAFRVFASQRGFRPSTPGSVS